MGSIHHGDGTASTSSSTSAAFVLGADGPSPGRKGARRASGISKIPLRPAGVNSSYPVSGAPAAPGSGRIQQQAQPASPQAARSSATRTGAGLAPGSGTAATVPPSLRVELPPEPAPGAGLAGVGAPGSQATGRAPAIQQPMFAVGAADGQPVGLGTPRGSRPRTVKHKPHGMTPTPSAPAATAAASAAAMPFSPIALTPMDENTYQKFGLRPEGTSPMDITPEGSMASSMASAASNVFLFSPLVGFGNGGQTGGAGGAAHGGGTGASSMVSPPPFQGFNAAVPEASPSSIFPAAPSFGRSNGTATGPAPAAQLPGQPFSVFVRTSSSGGASAPTSVSASAGAMPGCAGGSATNSAGLKFPIQIPIPGAREVQNMFSVATGAFGSAAPGAGAEAASKGAPAVAAATASGAIPAMHGEGAMAAAVAAAASKKLPDDSCDGSSGAPDGKGQFSQACNDCQPAKDNAPKMARMSGEGNGNGPTPGAGTDGASSGPAGPTPPLTTSASSGAGAAPAGASTALADNASAVPGQVPPGVNPSAMDAADVTSPDVLAALAEQLENMARRAREAAAAAAAAKANAKDPVTSSPAVRTVIEMMLRPPSADADGSADAASTPGPVAAAVASLIGGLKLDDSSANQPRNDASANMAAAGSSARAPSAGSTPATAASAGVPFVPFVFGGSAASSNAGSSGGAGPEVVGVASTSSVASQAAGMGAQQPSAAAPGPPPSVPFVFGASGSSSMARGPAAEASAKAFASGGAGLSPFPPFGASVPSAPTGATPSVGAPGSGFTSVPFMFGAASQPPHGQSAASAGSNGAFAAGARPQPAFSSFSPMASSQPSVGPSPMSTTPTPTAQPPQATASSFTGWTNTRCTFGPPGAEAPQFTMGASPTTVGGSGAAPSSGPGAGGTPGRSARSRSKITPRKTRAASSTPAATQSAGTSAAAAPSTSTTSRPAATAATAPQVGVSAPPGVSRPTQPLKPQQLPLPQQPSQPPKQQQPQPSQSTSSGDGLDPLAVQAIRIKRSADEKKQYGNQKYEQSDFRSAERWYTEAIEALEQQLPALSLPRDKQKQLFPTLQTEIAVLYSNRSGARLMTSKPQSALDDALKAMALDPKFMRAASRAATCHCRMGDFAAAHRIIDSAMDRCSASSTHYQEMLKKLNEVVDLGSRARAATAAAVAAAASGARDKLTEAADQLAALRDQVAYCDVIAAARAVLALRLGSPREALTLVAPHPEVPLAQRAAPWRLWLTVQARYFRGDLQDAMTTCRELHLALQASPNPDAAANGSGDQSSGSPGGSAAAAAYTTSAHVTVPPPEVLSELADSIQQQLKLKEEGNAAIKAGRHSEAADLYTRALAMGCPPAYAALLHANRAAAHTGLGQLAEAVADCGRARALDPNYYKASARLASLMMELRRPENAVGLLDPLTKLGAQADGAGPAVDELAALKDRLNEARSAAKWMKTPHHYKMLGLTNSCSEEEVRKAYRRLALKHHPDKATSSVKVALALSGAAGGAPYGGPLAGGSELEARMREEAAWLFNLINQAHEELSDKARRRKVDQLLDVEQPPAATRYSAGASASNPYANWFNSSRYSGFSSYYGSTDPFFSYRPTGAAPTGTGSTKGRTSTGSGASSTYGYGTYNAPRPSSSRPAGAASNGGAGAGTRPAGTAASGASRGSTAGANAGYGGFGRTAGSGAGTRTSAGGRKWWEGGYEDSDDEDQDTFNF